MIRIFMLLLGTHAVRRSWPVLLAGGIALELFGVAIFIDGMDGVVYFPLHVFGYFLLFEGAAMLFGATTTFGTQRRLLQVRGVAAIVLSLLILYRHHSSDLILAMLFGAAVAADGVLRIAAAWVVRFRGWRVSIVGGILELLFAVFLLEPYPTHYAGTVPLCIGVALFLTGWGLIRFALQLRALKGGRRLPQLFSRGWLDTPDPFMAPYTNYSPPEKLTVRVWTAAGTAVDPLHRPVVDRYIAAVDSKGVVSTGHAAMEVKPDIYISHYPAQEIDHSPEDFNRLLRATKENDIPGTFQPSYEYESSQWCESTVNVEFERYNLARLKAFWEHYRKDNTYNLTNRNCSSTVAHALETALEGVLTSQRLGWRYYARLLCSPELLVASELRTRAETMAWTPGLVLDYSRALYGTMNPPKLAWLTLWRYLRAMFRRGTTAGDARGA